MITIQAETAPASTVLIRCYQRGTYNHTVATVGQNVAVALLVQHGYWQRRRKRTSSLYSMISMSVPPCRVRMLSLMPARVTSVGTTSQSKLRWISSTICKSSDTSHISETKLENVRSFAEHASSLLIQRRWHMDDHQPIMWVVRIDRVHYGTCLVTSMPKAEVYAQTL